MATECDQLLKHRLDLNMYSKNWNQWKRYIEGHAHFEYPIFLSISNNGGIKKKEMKMMGERHKFKW